MMQGLSLMPHWGDIDLTSACTEQTLDLEDGLGLLGRVLPGAELQGAAEVRLSKVNLGEVFGD